MYEVLHFNQESMEQLTTMHWICVDADYITVCFSPTQTCASLRKKRKKSYIHIALLINKMFIVIVKNWLI